MPRGETPPPAELRREMTSIRELEQQLQTAKIEARRTGDVSIAKQLQAALVERVNELRDQLNPFEARIHVREQYQAQAAILEATGILQDLSDGRKGIKGIDGQEYPLPTYQEISRRMVEKREVLNTKIEQGFDKMLLVPFGMPLDTLIDTYRTTLQRHFDDGKLFHTKINPADPLEVLNPITELNADGPLYVWDQYQGADQVDPNTNTTKMVYNPKEFSSDHQGKTKPEIIQVSGGWKILLIENMPNIPRGGQAQSPGGRTQIDTAGTAIRSYMEAGKTVPNPHEYLAALRGEAVKPESPYVGEQGMTPEDQMMYAITHLEEENQVIDDVDVNGRISWQIGAYSPASGNVPLACWDRDDRRAYLDRNDPGNRGGSYGLRSAVGV